MIPRSQAARKRRGKLYLLGALLVLHVAVSLLAVVPGHLSVDEGTYHMMVRDRAAGRGFEIWNGYRERPSPELIPATLVVRGGRLVAVPPELFTFLSLPFYLALGYRGLFLLNAIAFAATVALAARVAWRLTDDPDVGLDTALLLTLSTFLWEYSQAAWPHATATFMVVAAFAAAVEALLADPGGRRLAWAFAAGMLGGAAVGVRVDSAVALPMLLLPFLFARPVAVSRLGAAVAGAALPLLLLAWINHEKFGIASPLTYGLERPDGELARYLPPAAAAAAMLLLTWLASRRRVAARLRPRWLPAVALAAGAAAAVLVVPGLREMAVRGLFGLWQLVVDFRPRPPIFEPALSRTPDGGMVYLGALKKSLLQSCPYLTSLVLPAAALLAQRGDSRQRSAVLLLCLVPTGYIGFYGYFAWHGGLALNLRYWTPALPFLAALGALAWRWLAVGAGSESGPQSALRLRVLAAAGAATVAAHLGLRLLLPGPEAEQFVLLDVPLALAALLLLASGTWTVLAARGRPAPALRRTAAVIFVAGAAWAACVALGYDYPRHTAHRGRNLSFGSNLRSHVPQDSILFVLGPDAYYALLEVPRLRLAVAPRDGFADFRELTDFHLAAGRPVLLSMPPANLLALRDRELLRDLELRPLLAGGMLVELRRAPAAGPAALR